MNYTATPPTKDHGPVEYFSVLWQQSDEYPDVFEFLANHVELSLEETVEICVIDQASRWRSGTEFQVEQYLEKIEAISTNLQFKLRLIQHEFDCRCERGPFPEIHSFVSRFPENAEVLRARLRFNDEPTVQPQEEFPADPLGITHLEREKADVKPVSNSELMTAPAATDPPPYKPTTIGRYRVLSVLGDGGFGRVFLAQDDFLNRNVAIKIAHHHVVARSGDVESYLTEARIVSSLDHPSIVPVFDCGHTEDGICYVVSKYIDGSDLATKIKRSPLSSSAAADLVATLAQALHFAHDQGVVHRDVKPANILIDAQGRPYLADFGIAMREEDFGTGNNRIGTIAYMSPEQLRGEGHLVDGRTDIFSLGIVLYELLTGHRPFPHDRLETTTAIEPRPLRRNDNSVPRELERICLKAMSYRVVDRYNAAIEMSTDLHSFLQLGTASQSPPPKQVGLSGPHSGASSGNQVTQTGIQIVPKGLRSFDRDDAGFFLELLPGPRDRDGMPESIRFWKTRLQATESEPFRVGVIYGPSGCGKSSFLKAGVLPQLSKDIVPVYVESTPLETETRLLKALRRACPELPPDRGLAESMGMLRRQRSGTTGRRLLIVIDQFEQWLHTRSKDGPGDLLRALRQCDGIHLQCIITVRDDFWMAVTQFMNELEINLVPGDNLAALDLFNVRHAKRVLTAIGQAYQILPNNAQEIGKDHKSFLAKAVADLAHNEQVIPVQLALFAEMIKDKPWTLGTLKSVGGTEGVGVTFLEETFNGRAAPPHHRLHQKAARAVLQTLLSDGASGIKGAMRSYQDLLTASGYADSPREFDALLRILDSELRLITPTVPEGLETTHDARASSNDQDQYFHLTHDYLVPSLREWLTCKRKETRRGRAELLLADRAAAWSQQPTERSLPSIFEWFSIMLFAGRQSRRENQKLLAVSRRYYGSRAIAGVAFLFLAFWCILQQIHYARASALVESLASARGPDLLKSIEKLKPYRQFANPLLGKALQSAETPTQRLHIAMALLPVDSEQMPIVYEGMLGTATDEFATIRDSLAEWGDKATISRRLWEELLGKRNDEDKARRFRAGAALATFDAPGDMSPNANWKKSSQFLSEQLVAEIRTNLGDFDQWVSALRPARNVLFPQLEQIFSRSDTSEIDRHATATILADFVKDQPRQLVDLIVRSPAREYGVLIPKLRELGEQGKNALQLELTASIPASSSLDEQNRISKRRAYAAVALLEFETAEPLVAILSERTDDPTLCTYAEDRLFQLGNYPEALVRLMDRANTTLLASLLRSLAGIKLGQLSVDIRDSLTVLVTSLFQNNPDSGVHSAAEWALRSWGLGDQLTKLKTDLASTASIGERNWHVNSQGQTMIVFSGPIMSRTGSPGSEQNRDATDETISTRKIDRDFAICSTEVTAEQFLKFIPTFRHQQNKSSASKSEWPISIVTWFRAAEYCNWLSEAEHIPPDQWCYRKQDVFTKTAKSPDGELMETMQPEEGCLSRTGYRLLTEAEWEYACRAGTTTPYSWGSDTDVSRRYVQFAVNSSDLSWPVAILCPNRFGLFDMHGNVGEWVHDRYNDILPEFGNDSEDKLTLIDDDSVRVVRGYNPMEGIPYQRSANRASAKARNGVSPRLGFRIGRTIAVPNRP